MRCPWGDNDPDWYKASFPDPSPRERAAPFRCDTCGKRFTTGKGRDAHAVAKHGDAEAGHALWPPRKKRPF